MVQWVALSPLFEVCARETGYEVGGWRSKVWWLQESTENNFGPPWKTHGELKGGGGAVWIWACSSTATVREMKSGWLIGMLGRRLATPRWVNDLVWQLEILVWRQGEPRCEDEPVRWIWRVLGNLERIGSIHNNKRQSLGLE